MMNAASPPLLGPGEVIKNSGKFTKPTRIPGKNYCKDEVVIRNSDSGKGEMLNLLLLLFCIQITSIFYKFIFRFRFFKIPYHYNFCLFNMYGKIALKLVV